MDPMDNRQEKSPLISSSPPSSSAAASRAERRANTYCYGSTPNGRNPEVAAIVLPQSDPSSTAQLAASHCHDSERRITDPKYASNVRARRTLIIASALCLSFMLAELVGGYLASSLAIVTDAAHLLTDFASFMISLFSLYMAARPATRRMSFGWHRAEVLGAFISVLMIWLVTGVLVYMAIMRIVSQSFEVDGKIMLITAALGVAVNLVMGIILHRGGAPHGHSHGGHAGHGGHNHSDEPANPGQTTTATTTIAAGPPQDDVEANTVENHRNIDVVAVEHDADDDHHHSNTPADGGRRAGKQSGNINVQAAFIHVVGDFIQSIGVFVAAIVIYAKPDLGIIDPICTFIFSVLVLLTTLAIMKDALNVLMEGLPRGIDFVEVTESLLALDGVERVHDLRIWCLTMDKPALAVHLAVDRSKDTQMVLSKARELLRGRYNIYECTVQIEHYTADMNECHRCEVPKA